VKRAASKLAALPRRLSYALAAAGLATGAPIGLLVVRLMGKRGADFALLRRQLEGDWPTFLYVTLSTLVVFVAFGYVLGRQADALVELSRTDPLTGLSNPRAFAERLEEETARVARYGEPLSLLVLDVDRLKAINDRGGHGAGDLALQAVARALHSGARQTDLAARLGGDEFALIAPSTPPPAATALGERIQSLLAGEGVNGLSVSLGVATMEQGRSADSGVLREAADAALYEAKRQGRNRVVSA
jgi:two-component system cell cycle response regulator